MQYLYWANEGIKVESLSRISSHWITVTSVALVSSTWSTFNGLVMKSKRKTSAEFQVMIFEQLYYQPVHSLETMDTGSSFYVFIYMMHIQKRIRLFSTWNLS